MRRSQRIRIVLLNPLRDPIKQTQVLCSSNHTSSVVRQRFGPFNLALLPQFKQLVGWFEVTAILVRPDPLVLCYSEGPRPLRASLFEQVVRVALRQPGPIHSGRPRIDWHAASYLESGGAVR